MKRTRFTKRELELILDMSSIAEAGMASEGDYQEWTDADYGTLDRLSAKVFDRLDRSSSSGRLIPLEK